MMLQAGGAMPTTPLELLLISSVETKVVLAILLVFSLIAWAIIVLKWWQFRRLNRQGEKFFNELERTTRLQEGYHAAMKQPPSPFNRVFREAINFYSELRPGALKEEVARTPLTQTQLESLKLVLAKEVSAEKDMLSHYVPWLATVGAVGPLMGLMGTVLGSDGRIHRHLGQGLGQHQRRGAGGGRGTHRHGSRPRGRDSRGDRLQHLREQGAPGRERARGVRRGAHRHDGA